MGPVISKNKNHKPVYVYCVRGQMLDALVLGLKPHLVVKSRQASVMSRFRSTFYGKGCSKGKKLHMDVREECYKQMRKLNKRGV